ncbi:MULTISPECIES: DUF3175 domain-containing protein [Ralstonia solanacearum species complex]|uniref:DUF3175 domain-containing protein n=1 Tax=Ralstonia solanacearum species complex TaxID=3116862 RepID=UPI000E573453|nr:DUF3175 domain-containing protein [Ralstonia solanacearum]BEU74724.1 DUF3175 domain-containing protein [Ralstonia pseudosolanacearum]AXV79552.1 hypothetical protein CJO76_21825 [Ralstonia solanacearum]AXV93579.1 hypothetical protein CJO79_21805 [Ralstonia solanacearum]AXW21589.1 hypothetical protein CJO85_21905 [Ralstonia solanacearum]AXW78470.1 hypothetical protein CJO97_21805 [Ralstonia solanacearum]
MATSRTKAVPSRARKPAAASASRSEPTAAARKRKDSPHRWSHRVTQTSDALDLAPSIFKSRSPDRIAASLKASAEHSRRRKGSPFQSAMSMLTFYINRAGRNLSDAQRGVLERAKDRLRIRFGRPAHGAMGKGRRH